ncbi:MAG: hypothetical protein ACLQU1_41920 [Bryobacteraceae bacterium]
MRCVAMALLLAGVTFAQKITDPAQLPRAVRELDGSQAHTVLPCTVEILKPALNFSFRFQTGYRLRAPLNPDRAGGRHWYLVFRVTPLGGRRRPVYFADSIDIPASAPPDAVGRTTGAFLLGEGRYDVKWSLQDESGRVCQKEWTLDARLARNDRSTEVMMPPGTVGDLSWRSQPDERPDAGADRDRFAGPITVLMNAALLNPARIAGPNRPGPAAGPRPPVNNTGPLASRWVTLVGILASLLERLPAASVRLVVFNPNQQKELFRQEGFTLDGIGRIEHAGDELQQWSVDYHVLQNPAGSWDLLADLVNREIHAAPPSDAVVFLGLPSGISVRMPAGFPGPAAAPAPRFFYLRYRPSWPSRSATEQRPQADDTRRASKGASRPPGSFVFPGEAPDSIDQTVRRLKGKTFTIYTPAEFAKAIDEIEHRAPR